MIDRSTVEHIFETVNILDVVQEFVQLRRRGASYIGLCPFHGEKTPSFSVSPAKGLYKCFGCGKAGNSVGFIMEIEHMSYYEALRFLARKYNITITEHIETHEEILLKTERDSLFIITSFAQRYFSELLKNHHEGKTVGFSYFIERGFREDIIEKFQLGYCINSQNDFSQKAVSQGYKEEFLIKAGLSVQREQKLHDVFINRVIFPIHSVSGQVIAFGARTLRSDKNIPKYINSPETEIYHKSKIVYGIFQAKHSIIQQDKCYLTEGYTDVISLHQSGITNVVASSGTSLTTEQVRLIKRFTNNITILYDGDEAGIKASLRGIDIVLAEGMNVKVLLFPDGEDPDSFSRKVNPTELQKFIAENETDFILFKTNLLTRQTSGDPVKRASLITDILQSVSEIPDKITRNEYVKECSLRLKIREEILHQELTKIRRRNFEKKTGEKSFESKRQSSLSDNQVHFDDKTNEYEIYEREIIRLLICYGNNLLTNENQINESVTAFLVSQIMLEGEILSFSNPLYKRIFDEVIELQKTGFQLNDAYFIYHNDDEVSQLAIEFVAKNYPLSQIWNKKDIFVEGEEKKLNDLVPQTIMAFKNKKVGFLLKEIIEKLKQTQEETEVNELLQRYMLLKQVNVQLSDKLGGRTIV